MPDAYLSVQNLIGSSLKLTAAWAISVVDLLHRNKGCC